MAACGSLGAANTKPGVQQMTAATRPSRENDGKGRTIRELLAGRKYSIDYYQREYKWQKKQVAELIDDLCDKFRESQGKTVCVVSCQRSPEPVFLKWKGMEQDANGDLYDRSGPGSVRLGPESAKEYIRTRFSSAQSKLGNA